MAGVAVITGTKFQSTIGYSPRTGSETATPGTAEPLEGLFRTINTRFNTPLLDPIVTLAQSPSAFVQRDVGPLEGTFGLIGYMGVGTLSASPVYLIGQQYSGSFAAVYGTGNTLTWNGKVTTEDDTFAAKDNSARQVSGIFTGTPTATWTTT